MVGAALPATGGGWIEGRAPHIGRLLVVCRCALIVRADRLLSIGGPSPGDEVDDRHRDVRLVRAPRRRRDPYPDDGRRNAGGTGPQGRGAETGEIDQAIRLAQNTEFDLAILDVNVQGKLITPVAELITTLMRPIIFATGYETAGVPEEFRGRPSVEKPFLVETLARTIDLTLRSHRSENEAPWRKSLLARCDYPPRSTVPRCACHRFCQSCCQPEWRPSESDAGTNSPAGHAGGLAAFDKNILKG